MVILIFLNIFNKVVILKKILIDCRHARFLESRSELIGKGFGVLSQQHRKKTVIDVAIGLFECLKLGFIE